tara:strand:- start:780 stop:1631 length:852 start_codon:yes stop_codon:yes gene_type:complete
MSLVPKKGERYQNGKKGDRHQKGKELGRRQNRKLAYKEQKKNQLGWLQQIKAKSIRTEKIMKGNNKDQPKELSEFEKVVQSCYVEWWISHVKLGRCEIQDAPDWIKEDKRVAQSSIEANPWSIQFVQSVWSDIEMVSMAVSIRPAVLECLPMHWRNNHHVMKIAFESSMISCYYLGERLKKLPGFEFLLKCEDENCLGFGNIRLNRLDQEVSHQLMKHDGFLLFLAGTLNQSLLISKLGGHSGLLTREVFDFVGPPSGDLLWALLTAKQHIKAGLKQEVSRMD